jgi:hypothetical protein
MELLLYSLHSDGQALTCSIIERAYLFVELNGILAYELSLHLANLYCSLVF